MVVSEKGGLSIILVPKYYTKKETLYGAKMLPIELMLGSEIHCNFCSDAFCIYCFINSQLHKLGPQSTSQEVHCESMQLTGCHAIKSVKGKFSKHMGARDAWFIGGYMRQAPTHSTYNSPDNSGGGQLP